MRHTLDDNQEISRYLEKVADHTLLSRGEELRLAGIWAKRNKNKPTRRQLDAHDLLIKHNVKLVISIAKNYRNRGVPFIEVIQEGIIGLGRALKTYDPTRGVKLSTYATWWIRQACQRAVAQQGATIRVPAHVNFRRARAYEIWEKRPDATIEQIAEELECKPHHIEEALDVVRATYSLNRTSESGDVTSLADTKADPFAEDPSDVLESRDFMRARDVRSVLARIEPDERAVIELRFGFNGKHAHSFAEISKALKIPAHRCQMIQKTALRKLERLLESDDVLSTEGSERRDRAVSAASSHTARQAPVSVPLLDEDIDELADLAEFMRLHDLCNAAAEVEKLIADILGTDLQDLIEETVLGRCDHAYESCIQEDGEDVAC